MESYVCGHCPVALHVEALNEAMFVLHTHSAMHMHHVAATFSHFDLKLLWSKMQQHSDVAHLLITCTPVLTLHFALSKPC